MCCHIPIQWTVYRADSHKNSIGNCSEANGDYIFQDLMQPSPTPVSFETFIWDSLELRLFQVHSPSMRLLGSKQEEEASVRIEISTQLC